MPGHTLSVSRHETIILINNWILLHYTYGRTCPAKWVAASSALANVCNQRGSCLSYLPHALAAAAGDADIKMQLTFHYIATLRFRRGQLAACVWLWVLITPATATATHLQLNVLECVSAFPLTKPSCCSLAPATLAAATAATSTRPQMPATIWGAEQQLLLPGLFCLRI